MWNRLGLILQRLIQKQYWFGKIKSKVYWIIWLLKANNSMYCRPCISYHMSNWPKSICQRNRERSLQCALKQVLKMVARNFSCRNLFFPNPLSTENFLKLQAKFVQQRYFIWFPWQKSFSRLVIKNWDSISKIEEKSIFNTSSPNGQGKLSHLSCFVISYNLPGMSWRCHQVHFDCYI